MPITCLPEHCKSVEWFGRSDNFSRTAFDQLIAAFKPLTTRQGGDPERRCRVVSAVSPVLPARIAAFRHLLSRGDEPRPLCCGERVFEGDGHADRRDRRRARISQSRRLHQGVSPNGGPAAVAVSAGIGRCRLCDPVCRAHAMVRRGTAREVAWYPPPAPVLKVLLVGSADRNFGAIGGDCRPLADFRGDLFDRRPGDPPR